ncbi:hypothetical protein E2C01_076994 [Portunus trituberculatus]|uniref:Uncharacterized protein n=1 Tax=Portunus trituberculatus TaxID=210409 RepID=A0A5B7IJ42_PORTR|nr:hypothetical protein [Portunus trituberculatus]
MNDCYRECKVPAVRNTEATSKVFPAALGKPAACQHKVTGSTGRCRQYTSQTYKAVRAGGEARYLRYLEVPGICGGDQRRQHNTGVRGAVSRGGGYFQYITYKMSSYETFEPTTYPWGPCVFMVSFLSIVISFCSPYWLVNDGEMEEGHFLNTGKHFSSESGYTPAGLCALHHAWCSLDKASHNHNLQQMKPRDSGCGK